MQPNAEGIPVSLFYLSALVPVQPHKHLRLPLVSEVMFAQLSVKGQDGKNTRMTARFPSGCAMSLFSRFRLWCQRRVSWGTGCLGEGRGFPPLPLPLPNGLYSCESPAPSPDHLGLGCH